MRGGVDLDLVTHDARKFFGLMLKPNGYVLEQVFSPHVVCCHPAFVQLRELALGCVTKHHWHHYRGFANNRWELFSKENPAGKAVALRLPGLAYRHPFDANGLNPISPADP